MYWNKGYVEIETITHATVWCIYVSSGRWAAKLSNKITCTISCLIKMGYYLLSRHDEFQTCMRGFPQKLVVQHMGWNTLDGLKHTKQHGAKRLRQLWHGQEHSGWKEDGTVICCTYVGAVAKYNVVLEMWHRVESKEAAQNSQKIEAKVRKLESVNSATLLSLMKFINITTCTYGIQLVPGRREFIII